MKKAIAIILLLNLVLCLLGCSWIEQTVVNSNRTYLITESVNTTLDGAYITLESINKDEKKQPVFEVKWHNETNNTITFGMGYYIERLDGEEWKSVQTSDFAIIEIACVMDPGQSGNQTYSGEYFSFKEAGTYRIRTEFYVPDENLGVQTTWATFEVLKQKN